MGMSLDRAAQRCRATGDTLSNLQPELLLIFEYEQFLKYFHSSTNEPVQPKRSFQVVHYSCG